MNYNLYQAEDFASDESFINWYLKKDAESILFWDNWKRIHPEKLDELYHAERLLDLVYLKLDEEELNIQFEKINFFLEQSENTSDHLKAVSKKSVFNKVLFFALGFFIIIGFWAVNNYYAQKKYSETNIITRHNPYGQRSIFQ